MDDLIKKLGDSQSGSVVLDCEIYKALGAIPVKFQDPIAGNETAYAYKGVTLFPPPYTTSLDAALTLVPEWAAFMSLNRRTQPEMGGRMWSVQLRAGGIIRSDGQRTPPLALCIAALKARQANDQSS